MEKIKNIIENLEYDDKKALVKKLKGMPKSFFKLSKDMVDTNTIDSDDFLFITNAACYIELTHHLHTYDYMSVINDTLQTNNFNKFDIITVSIEYLERLNLRLDSVLYTEYFYKVAKGTRSYSDEFIKTMRELYKDIDNDKFKLSRFIQFDTKDKLFSYLSNYNTYDKMTPNQLKELTLDDMNRINNDSIDNILYDLYKINSI